MTDNLEELERLLAKATPGEWRVIPYYTGTGPDEVCRGMLAVDDDWPTGIISETDPPLDGVLSHDLDLIVALRNAAPSLIATAREVEGLRAEVARLTGLAKANNDLARIEVAFRKKLAFERAEMANALEAVTSQYGDRLPAQFLADLTAMLMRPALRAGAALEGKEPRP